MIKLPVSTISLCALALLGSACDSSQTCELPPEPDPAPHQSGFVTLPGAVRLHYLDFGGQGAPLILLAGAGNSAHVFDTFAPSLVDGFRVLALSRRGFGESDQPAQGYDTATLAEDIAGFMDAMAIERASLVGHSIAGAEMTRLAQSRPERVAKLVYLDAAYDWAASAATQNPAPTPEQPGPTPAQLTSPEAFAGYVAWTTGVSSFPLADVLATNVFDCGGRYLRPRTSADVSTRLAAGAAAAHPDYAAVTAPSLAIYTVPEAPADMFPWLAPESAQWTAAEAFFPFARDVLASQRRAFAAARPDALLVEMPRVPHFLFLASPEAVAAHTRAFLATP